MKHQRSVPKILSVAVALAILTHTLVAEVTFSGFLVFEATVHVILIDSDSGRSSGWIQVGQTFDRYRVTRYEPQSERLIVSLDQKEHSLPLTGGSKVAAKATVVKIGSRDYTIYSDSREKQGNLMIFRGHVTGLSNGAHFSCDEMKVEGDNVVLAGSVKFQHGTSLITAKHLRMSP